MRRSVVWVLCVGLIAACKSGPQIRKGPPLKLTFAPPQGLQQTARSDQERTTVLRFPDKTGEGTSLRQIEEADETFAPLPNGGYRVTSRLLSQSLVRDGQQVTPPLSTVGLSLVFRIDQQGKFVMLENAEEVIRALRERAKDETQRKVIENTLTPEVLEAIPRESWRDRHERFCGRTFNPGDTEYFVSAFELPIAARIPVRALVKQQVLGQTSFGVTPVMELHLTFVGGDSDIARSSEAQNFLTTLPPGERALTSQIQGEGRRLVSLSTCETIDEKFDFDGEIPLPKGDPGIPKAVVPTSVQFRVKQQIARFSPQAGRSL